MMNKEKQIEEITTLTSVIWEANHKRSVLDYHWLATEVYNAGYRKSSDVAREIFEVIDNITDNLMNSPFYSSGDAVYDLNELKKKYTESEKDNG